MLFKERNMLQLTCVLLSDTLPELNAKLYCSSPQTVRQKASVLVQQEKLRQCFTHTNELTGKMKLVSGGSSSVNLSIQVSRSAIDGAVNCVLSDKNRRGKN